MSEFEAVPGPSAGTLLRRAREAAGLHVEALAASLKVPAAKLEALEADRYEELPDAVFARALASSICRTLKVDPRPVLERLPLGGRSKLGDQQPINAPLRQPEFSGSRRGLLDQVSRPVALTVVALLLAAVVLIFLPAREEAPTTQVEPVMPPGSPAVTAAPAESRASELPGATSAPPTPGATAPAAPEARAAEAAAPFAAASAPPTTATSLAATAPAAPAAANAPPSSTDGIVTFRAKGSSWVQVTDAKGAPVLRKLLAAGETASASGTLPLTVTVGSVQQTEVQVRGKPLDLASHARGNVAQFEVK